MKMKMSNSVHVVGGMVLAAMLAACGGGSQASGTETTSSSEGGEARREATPEESRIRGLCVQTMEHERQCSPQFVDAIVSLRARLDHPAGFRERDTADHAGLVAEATAEWERDSTDPRIGSTCTHFSELPAEQTEHFATLEAECQPMTDCAAFVACDMRFVEERFTRRAAEAAPAPTTP